MEARVKEEKKKVIAMVPACWAKEGTRFLFSGTFPTCGSCEFRSGCVSSLIKGRDYEIVRLRKRSFTCPHQGTKYQVVEAKPSRLELAIPKERCFEGTILQIAPNQCERRFCENYWFCVPEGTGGGNRWKIVQLLETIECPEGRALVKASLEPVPLRASRQR
ncbi:MAG: UPF0179 family protein [Aigarchaeota archaeon]|nr:UPF0179 family protein [Aigarchaeota archaeon]